MDLSHTEKMQKNIPIREAADRSGYSTGYLSYLCRTGKIVGKYSRGGWSVDFASLTGFIEAQAERKEARARSLARARAEEYRVAAHRPAKTPETAKQISNFKFLISKQFLISNFQSNKSKFSKPTLRSAPRLLTSGFPKHLLRSEAFAVAVAVLVVAGGALGARAEIIPQAAQSVLALASETASGFAAAYGDVPGGIVARVISTRSDVNKISERVAVSNGATTASIASPMSNFKFLISNQFQSSNFQTQTFGSVATTPEVPTSEPVLTVEDLRASARVVYAMLASPRLALNALADAYRAIGASGYGAIANALAAYRALIDESGARALALAASTRDAYMLALAPLPTRLVTGLGQGVIDATHAAIRSDVGLAYATAEAAPASARATVAIIGNTGDMLARATSRVPALATAAFLRATAAPAHIAPAIAQAVFDAEYAVAERFVAGMNEVTEGYLALVNGTGNVAYASAKPIYNLQFTIYKQFPIFKADASVGSPTIEDASGFSNLGNAVQDAYLGALGKMASAIENVKVRLTQNGQLAAVASGLSAGEQVALATYETLNGWFSSASRMLATLVGSSSPVVVPEVKDSLAVASSTQISNSQLSISPPKADPPPAGNQFSSSNAPARPQTVTTYPTYVTTLNGVSVADVNRLLAVERATILATVSGMIQPVAAQGVTNMTTIQQVNMIDDLTDLIVRNGDFRGGTFTGGSLSGGVYVGATTGVFGNLTAGATSLTGDLLTVGGITSYTSATAPYFIATSTTATSTFAGGLTVGTDKLVIDSTTGRIGIGTTSPVSTLGVVGESAFAGGGVFGLGYAGTAAPADGLIVQGSVGIGTTSPSYALSVAGDLMLGGTAGAVFTSVGSGLTFTGTGNHDITALGGTLRIGSNTIIGNIQALDDTVDIGTPVTRFDKIYANEVNATSLVGTLTGGNLIAETFTINSDNASADAENGYLVFERGSVTPSASLSWNSAESAKRFELNHPLYIENASASTTLTTLDLKAVAGQTGDLFRISSSSSATLFNVTAAGRLGILTASPTYPLEVTGAGRFTSLVDADHFVATSTTATSTFAGGFSVGQCVTGDTRLRRRRRRADGSYDYDEPDIVDIKEGDEIQSLDEKTGKLVWSRVKQLAFMGKKQTYRIITEDGRSIRTTANHPYLTNRGWKKVSELKEGAHIAVAKPRLGVFVDDANMFYGRRKAGMRIDYKQLKSQLDQNFDVKFFNYHMVMPASWDKSYAASLSYQNELPSFVSIREKAMKYIKVKNQDGTYGTQRKGDIDMELAIDVLHNLDTLDSVLMLAGDSDYAVLRDEVLRHGKKIAFASFRDTIAWEIRRGGPHILLDALARENAKKRQTPSTGLGVLLRDLLYSGGPVLSSLHGTGVDNDAVWARVLSITSVAEEDVYDVEIEGTHNFIGNGIVAHNTAFVVNQGAPAGSLYVAPSGNVGIGTTNPGSFLEVSGTLPSAPVATVQGVNLSITGAGSGGQGQVALNTTLNVGYTGGVFNAAIVGTNNTVGGVGNSNIDTGSWSSVTGVFGRVLNNSVANGISYGVLGSARGSGASGTAVGVAGVMSASGPNVIGVLGSTGGQGTVLNIGGLFTTNGTLPISGLTSAALIADNGSATSPIFLARDNQNTVFSIIDGGNVGIGTTTPQSGLHLYGDRNTVLYQEQTAFTPMPDINDYVVGGINHYGALADPASTSNQLDSYIQILSVNTNSGMPTTRRGSVISFGVANSNIGETLATERMRIDYTGRVGIGVTAPKTKLDVVGVNTLLADGGAGTNSLLNLQTTSAFGAGVGPSLTFTGNYRAAQPSSLPFASIVGAKATADENQPAGYLAFSTFNNSYVMSEKMRIDSTGNVGIGTTSPNALLAIRSTSGNGATLNLDHPGTADYGGMYFQEGGVSKAYIQHFGSTRFSVGNPRNNSLEIGTLSTNSISFRPNDTVAMTILNDGNVGIGTTSPTLPLSVTSSSGNSAYFAGAVGIGTNSPTETLEVAGAVRINPTNTTGILVFGNRDQGAGWYDTGLFRGGLNSLAGGNYLNVDAVAGIAFNVESGVMGGQATRMYVDGPTGYIGMGTTSPTSKLNVVDTSWSSGAPYGNVAYVLGQNTNDANWAHLIVSDADTSVGRGGSIGFGVGATIGTTYQPFAGIKGSSEGSQYGGIGFFTRPSGGTATDRLHILSTGNVGIGTTNPQEKLDVKGGGVRIQNGNNTNFTSNQITFGYGGDGSGNFRHAIKTRHDTNSYANNAIDFFVWDKDVDAASTVGTKHVMSLTGNGNVGIGTTSPLSKLDIAGGQLRMDNNQYLIFRDSTGLNNKIGMVGTTDNALRFDVGGSERLRITTAGNVGIGTTSPTSKLSIQGSGATSATYALSVTNSAGTSNFAVRDDGSIYANSNLTYTASGVTTASFNISPTVRNLNASNNTFLNLVNVSPSIIVGGGFANGSQGSKVVSITPTFSATTTADLGQSGSAAIPVLSVGTSFSSLRNVGLDMVRVDATINNFGDYYVNGFANRITVGAPSLAEADYVTGFYSQFAVASGVSVTSNAPLVNFGVDSYSGSGTAAAQIAYYVGSLTGATSNTGLYFANTPNSGSIASAASTHIAIMPGSGGNVGIGTTSPSARLSIKGAGSTTGRAFVISDSADVEKLTVLDNGSVGIGTTNPANGKLVVVGNILSDSFGFNNIAGDISGTGGAANSIQIRDESTNTVLYAGTQGTYKGNVGIGTTTPAYKLSINSTNSTDNLFQIATTTNQEIFAVNSAGGVGIGTTPRANTKLTIVAPGAGNYVLHIPAENGNTGFRIERPAANNSRLTWYGSGTAVVGSIVDSGGMEASGPWGFNPIAISDVPLSVKGTSGQTANIFNVTASGGSAGGLLNVRANGNVGIGTTVPFDKLDVSASGAGTLGGRLVITNSAANATSNSSELAFKSGADFVATYYTGAIAVQEVTSATDDNAMIFRLYDSGHVPAGAEKMRITSTGNVGIGTVSPQARLVVSTGASGGGIEFVPSSIGTQVIQAYDRGGAAYLPLGFDTNATGGRTMTLTTTGNVGIGTTSPSALLSLGNGAGAAGTTAALGINFGDPLANLYRSGAGAIKTDGSFTSASSLNGASLAVSASNSGVYTTLVRMNNSAVASNITGTSLSFDGTPSSVQMASVGGMWEESDTLNGSLIMKTRGSDSLTEKMRILGNGNVGIGTTTPQAKLNVTGDTDYVNDLNPGVGQFWITGATDPRNRLGFGYDTTDNYGFIAAETYGSTWRNLALQPDAGNVGIGTTTPQTPLSVSTPVANANQNVLTLTAAGNWSGKVGKNTNIVWSDSSQTLGGIGTQYNDITGTVDMSFHSLYNGEYKTDSDVVMTLKGSGNVGIGTTTPQRSLHVQGTVCLDLDANFACTDNTSALSDARLKTDVTDLTNALDYISELRPVRFKWNGEYNTGTASSLGFLAQEVEAVFPELVITDTAGYKNLDYSKLTAVLAGAVQALDARFAVPTDMIGATSTSAVLTADGKGIDLYKLATFATSNVAALAERLDAQETRLTSLEERLAALESGAISTASGSPLALSSSTLASALEGFGVLIRNGIAQFNTLVFRQLVASSDADGTSSAGSVALLAGNTVAQVANSMVLPSTKVFVTFNSQITGSWWVSDKLAGSFRVVLSAPQAADVSFDYFLVQTEGQLATSTPEVGGSQTSNASSGSLTSSTSGTDTTAPVITLLGDNPLHLSVGSAFVEPGVSVASGLPYITYVNGIEQEANASTIDTSSPTTYLITYKATDAAGEVATAIRSVIVGNPDGTVSAGSQTSNPDSGSLTSPNPADTVPPVVTLVGAAAMELEMGGIFTDPGATATDETDGDLTNHINVSGAVDTATEGSYTLTYSATDAAGNSASVSRFVTVIAAINP